MATERFSNISRWSLKHSELTEVHEDTHDSPRAQYLLSVPNYLVYNKNLSLSKEVWSGSRWSFIAYLITVSVENSSTSEMELGQPHLTVWGLALLAGPRLDALRLGPQHLCKKPDWQHTPVTPVLGRQTQILGASQTARVTIPQWFQMQWIQTSKK